MPDCYRVEVAAREAGFDADGREALQHLHTCGLSGISSVRSARVYELAGTFSQADARRLAEELLSDPVVETYSLDESVFTLQPGRGHWLEVGKHAGVMEPAEASIRKGAELMGVRLEGIRLMRRYQILGQCDPGALKDAALQGLANAVIEDVAVDAPLPRHAPSGSAGGVSVVPLSGLDDAALMDISVKGQLSLSLVEMRAAQAYFDKLGRPPTDVELETIAQTWSEHCAHKTFRGDVRYREDNGPEELIKNLLKSTVFKATKDLNKDWCWSVFEDNAGVIDFDGKSGIAVKVETHNHPSALEPYGGAGTGIGGVIRDLLGTGLGSEPIMNTDVFCFAPLDTPAKDIPIGVLPPARICSGVVAGVRDYGNRIGIPTCSGTLCFDPRYLGNPLVYCGTVAMIPKDMAKRRRPKPGDLAIVVGGRTGRDGIHGATFSSIELDEDSELTSAGAVQIGNAIEEKNVWDFLIRARDAGLYSAMTDCGAGGFSSALGEMGAECGVRMDLDKAPLKYPGLSCAEIWISEAQERMVLAADENHLSELQTLAAEEEVELTVIGQFTDDEHLRLYWHNEEVCTLDMDFLHEGMPWVERAAHWITPKHPEPPLPEKTDYTADLTALLSAWNVCSKESIIRQYDHEVQGLSALKSLVGPGLDGPGDAVVATPRLGEKRGVAVSCGICPAYSDIDPYWMAAAAIDEALRNLVAVGAPLERCALLDNFSWGNCNHSDRLAGLVKASRGCHDIAMAYGTPFISGKDSLNNEYIVGGESLAIPGTLLVTAVAVMPDADKAVSMDLKEPGNLIYMVGLTRHELGGSEYLRRLGLIGMSVPKVDAELGKKIFAGLSAAASDGLVRAMHDCSEGGLAVTLAEMAFAGNLGLFAALDSLPVEGGSLPAPALLFSESQSRLVAEVAPVKQAAFEAALKKTGAPFAVIGKVESAPRLVITHKGRAVIDSELTALKNAWKKPLSKV